MNRTVFSISTVCLLYLLYMPTVAQNMASLEVPMGISFVYGFDYHPVHHTQLKANVGFAFGKNNFTGEWYSSWGGNFAVEQRYYYNILKRQSKGKNTLNKSANFFSIRPSYLQTLTVKEYDKEMDHILYSPVNWGLRRNIGNRFYFDSSVGIGPAYSINSEICKFMIDLCLTIGFKLF